MSNKNHFKIDRPGHIVVLDQQWHKLFEGKKPFRIAQLEKKLNKLLQEQGKVNTDYEGYKRLKKQMMDEIVASMNDNSESGAAMKQKNSRHINEINRKFDALEERKSSLPSEIEAVNSELLTESMLIFYKRLLSVKNESEQIAVEIEQLKGQLKDKVGLHEDKEEERTRLYTFMHDIAGVEGMEALDAHFLGGDK